MDAAAAGDARKVEELLSKGARVDARNENDVTALTLAADKGHTSTVELLLSKGAAVNTRKEPFLLHQLTPLLAAAQNGHTQVCRLLLRTGTAKLEDRRQDLLGYGTPLLLAANNSHTEVCQLLLAAGSDIEARDYRRQDTALHFAALHGNQRLLHLLRSHNADINSKNALGSTPLHTASEEGHFPFVVAFLKEGADPKLSAGGALPIHKAAQKNHSEVVRILIDQGRCSPDQVKRSAMLSITQPQPFHCHPCHHHYCLFTA